MKLLAAVLILLLQGCAYLTPLQEGQTAIVGDTKSCRTGTTVPPPGATYPAIAVTPEGGHALVMPPCGNTAVVVNPDGSHSIAVINGMTATIVTP